MELALEMGMPEELLSRVMTEREFRRWDRFRLSNALPSQRIVLQLAQIAQRVDVAMGGAKDTKLRDYVIEFHDPTADVIDVDAGLSDEQIVLEARQAFGFNPQKRKAA